MTGPRCQLAVIAWPVTASRAIPRANETQKPTAITSRCSRVRIASPPPRITISATASQGVIGPHQNASGSARVGPSSRKQTTRPMFEGLKM